MRDGFKGALQRLIVVRALFSLGGVEGFLVGSARSGNPCQLGHGDVIGRKADEVGQVIGVFAGAECQQPVFAGFGGAGAPSEFVQGGEELIGPTLDTERIRLRGDGVLVYGHGRDETACPGIPARLRPAVSSVHALGR